MAAGQNIRAGVFTQDKRITCNFFEMGKKRGMKGSVKVSERLCRLASEGNFQL